MNRTMLYQLLKGKPVALFTLNDAMKPAAPARAKKLIDLGWGIIGSRGTVKALNAAGLEAYDVALIKGRGPSSGHLVVTISDEIANAVLARSPKDLKELRIRRIPRVDLVWTGLYELEKEIADPDSTPGSVWSQTDIGGRVLLMEAAKGHRLAAYSVEGIDEILEWLQAGKPDEAAFLEKNAAKADFMVARYSGASADYHSQGELKSIFGERVKTLRYGENPWQTPAYLYKTDDHPLAAHSAVTVRGKEGGFVNITDDERAMHYMMCLAVAWKRNFDETPNIAVAVKHGNACGAAVGSNTVEVMRKLVECDEVAIFGGAVATNFKIGVGEAMVLREHHQAPETKRPLDVVIAPLISEAAQDELERIKDGCRMVEKIGLSEDCEKTLYLKDMYRQVIGGFLLQPSYNHFILNLSDPQVTYRGGEISLAEKKAIILGFGIGARTISNKVALTHYDKAADGSDLVYLIGLGAGQQDRVTAARLAIEKAETAGHEVANAIAWTSSFFPFKDGPETLTKKKVAVCFACSGSRKDDEVIEHFMEAGVPFVTIPNEIGRSFAWH